MQKDPYLLHGECPCRRSRAVSRLSRNQAAAASDSVRCSDARLIFVNTLRPPTHIVKASPEEGRWHGLLGVDLFNRALLQAPR